ncbi:MAG: hypothetical protein ACJATN_001986 [Neolewinella sp.]
MNRKHGNTETDHFRSTFVLKRLFTNKPEPLKPVFNHFAEIKIITMFAFSKTSLLYLLAFGLFLGFMSCDNELAQDTISPDFLTEEEMPDLLLESLPPPPDADPDEQRRSPCFRFVFPIEIRLRNGTIIAAGDAEELRAAHQRITASRARANFIYPFDVELASGTTVTVENFRILRRLFRSCRDMDEGDVTPCITINYPIQVTAGDSTLTINSRQELHQANQDFRPRGVSIVYPIDVTHTESGQVITLNDERGLYRLRRSCNNRGNHDDRGQSCYRLMFPVELSINETAVTVTSREEWREAVQTAGEDADVSIVYPVSIVNREGGEETVIADHDAWEAARELCD